MTLSVFYKKKRKKKLHVRSVVKYNGRCTSNVARDTITKSFHFDIFYLQR